MFSPFGSGRFSDFWVDAREGSEVGSGTIHTRPGGEGDSC
jgi:hypothetical protein